MSGVDELAMLVKEYRIPITSIHSALGINRATWFRWVKGDSTPSKAAEPTIYLIVEVIHSLVASERLPVGGPWSGSPKHQAVMRRKTGKVLENALNKALIRD